MKAKLLVAILLVLTVITNSSSVFAADKAILCIQVFPNSCSFEDINALELSQYCINPIIKMCRAELTKKEVRALKKIARQRTEQQVTIQPVIDPLL